MPCRQRSKPFCVLDSFNQAHISTTVLPANCNAGCFTFRSSKIRAEPSLQPVVSWWCLVGVRRYRRGGAARKGGLTSWNWRKPPRSCYFAFDRGQVSLPGAAPYNGSLDIPWVRRGSILQTDALPLINRSDGKRTKSQWPMCTRRNSSYWVILCASKASRYAGDYAARNSAGGGRKDVLVV